MKIIFEKNDNWEYCGELFELKNSFQYVYLGTLNDLNNIKYFKVLRHKTKTSDFKSVEDVIYVSDKLKIVKHKNGDIEIVGGKRLFSEVGLTFII